jgi:hypothetical protein
MAEPGACIGLWFQCWDGRPPCGWTHSKHQGLRLQLWKQVTPSDVILSSYCRPRPVWSSKMSAHPRCHPTQQTYLQKVQMDGSRRTPISDRYLLQGEQTVGWRLLEWWLGSKAYPGAPCTRPSCPKLTVREWAREGSCHPLFSQAESAVKRVPFSGESCVLKVSPLIMDKQCSVPLQHSFNWPSFPSALSQSQCPCLITFRDPRVTPQI